MDRELYEASLTGNTTTLQKLLHEDELMLDKALAANAPETPLHIAALRGHVKFAAQILNVRPELAKELNSQGLSPLHLASANGHVDIIKELLRAAPDSISCRDREGRSPLHTAAAKGRIEVIEELSRHNPELTGDLTSRGETVLHLCVKYEHMEALTRFIAMISDAELVNRRDGNGNTVLHLSTAMKHVPMIKFLIEETRVQVNTKNTSGLTALDVLAVCPRESIGDMEIEQILRRKGAKRAWELTQLTGEASEISLVDHPTYEFHTMENTRDHTSQEALVASSLDSLPQKIFAQWQDEIKKKHDYDRRNTVMVIGTLIMTVVFQSTLTPPGGLLRDDSKTNNNPNAQASAPAPAQESNVAGTSILDANHPFALGCFCFFNQFSFVVSLFLIFEGLSISSFFGPNNLFIFIGLLSMEGMYLSNSIPIIIKGDTDNRVLLAYAGGFSVGLLIIICLEYYIKRKSENDRGRDNETEAGVQP